MKYFTLGINELSRQEYEKEYFRLSDKDKAKVDSRKKEDDKKLTLASRILLRRKISEFYSVDEDSIYFDYNENGKPFIVGNPFEISISHSADTVAVAINESVVGIDIEKIRKTDLNLMKRFFESEEISYVLGGYQTCEDYNEYSSPSVLKRFFEVWTKKEAASKLDGRGLSVVQKISLSDYLFETELTEDEKYVVSVCIGKK